MPNPLQFYNKTRTKFGFYYRKSDDMNLNGYHEFN